MVAQYADQAQVGKDPIELRVREYAPTDLARIEELYKYSKKDFELPDLDGDPSVVIKQCLVDKDGIVRLAAWGRAQLNAFLLMDRRWATPAERLEAIEILQFAMIEKTYAMGFDEVTAEASGRFAKRLLDLGWERAAGMTCRRGI